MIGKHLQTLLQLPSQLFHKQQQKYGTTGAIIWWVLFALLLIIPLILRIGPGPYDGDTLKTIARAAKVDMDDRPRLAIWWQSYWQPGSTDSDGNFQYRWLEPSMYGLLGRWWAGVVAWGATLLALLTSRLWLSKHYDISPPLRAGLTRVPRWSWLAITIALIVGATLRIPSMNQGYWNDEIYANAEYIYGEWHQDPDTNSWNYQSKDWSHTLSNNYYVNNHLLYSLAARASHQSWQLLTGKAPHHWSEWTLRVPSLLGGLGTIWLAGWILARRGRPLAGLLSSWLLALHPWHIYFSSDARGYALMAFFLVLVLSQALRVIEAGGIRRWLNYGLAQAALLITYAPTIYILVFINLILLTSIFLRNNKTFRHRGFGRFLVGNSFGAVITLFFLLPFVPQLRTYFAKNSWADNGTMDLNWWETIGSHLLFGVRKSQPEHFLLNNGQISQWNEAIPPSAADGQHIHIPHPHSSLAELSANWGIFFDITIIALPLLAILGIISAWRLGWSVLALILSPVLGCITLWYITQLQGGFLFMWYLFPLILPVIWAIALSVETLGIRRLRWLCLPVIAILGLWTSMNTKQIAVQLRYERQPLRQTLASIFPSIPSDPRDSNTKLSVYTLGTSSGRVTPYAPQVTRLDHPDRSDLYPAHNDLNRNARHDHNHGKRVLFLACGIHILPLKHPETWQQLNSPHWVLVGEFPGTEPLFSYRVYEYLGHRPKRTPRQKPNNRAE